MNSGNLRVKFIACWAVLCVAKLMLAATLPLFTDEAFYAWEARSPAWAYSDLPGLTAWLAWLGQEAGGQHVLGLRLPFLLVGACLPWQVMWLARRWFGAAHGYHAGLLAMLMPLSGLLGVLALPDVPLVAASLLCLEAIARLRQSPGWRAAGLLAVALAIGALSHYRFGLVICAGLAGLVFDPKGRELLRDRRVWLALLLGALAWAPVLAWNLGNDAAGLRFQLVERNPWAFDLLGALWIPVQALVVTPALFALLLATLVHAWRNRRVPEAPWGLIAGLGLVSVAGVFVLGFFADRERVSFHWPLAGWLVLAIAAPVVVSRWRRGWRILVHAGAAAGLLLAMAFLALAAAPAARERLAASRLYPADFAGVQELARLAHDLPILPQDRVLAGNFAVAAQLAFALDRRDIRVLESPLNEKHGRAAQLRAWGLLHESAAPLTGPALLVLEDTATPLKQRLRHYQTLCADFGVLEPPRMLSVDHGRKRYLVYRIDPAVRVSGCVTPALAWIDAPAPRARVGSAFEVEGWAFKDGAGIARVDVLIDGRPVARARYGAAMPGVAGYWRVSTDPAHPNVGFSARVQGLDRGTHWLGLRLTGRDGSVETWPGQVLRVE